MRNTKTLARILLPLLCAALLLGLSTPALAQNRTYTVAQGDTLTRIAERFGTSIEEICDDNSIPDCNRIYIGQVLLLDSGNIGPGPVPHPNYCVIAHDDTLSKIAKRYGTTVQALTELNHIANPNLIYEGHRLRVR